MTQPPETSEIALMLHELREDADSPEELEQAALSRVRQRLAVSLTAHGVVDATTADADRAQRAPVAPSRRSRWQWGARSGAVAALAVGTALGASGHALVSFITERPAPTPGARLADAATPTPPRVVLPPKAAPAAPPATPEPIELSAAAVGVPSSPLPRSRLQKSASEVPAVEADFDPELRELERARRAVATNPSQALVALRVHGQRYPSSVLSQEREALTVKALVAAGRYAEARAAAASFSQRHPESMLLDSVQNAIRSIP